MVKHDRAYADWQAREQRKQAREEGHFYDRELRSGLESDMGLWMKTPEAKAHSVNQVSRRAGKSEALKGSGFDIVFFDEFNTAELNGSEEPKQTPNERPPTKVTDYDALFRRVEKKMAGRTLSGSEKRKVIAAENKRLQQAAAQWDIDHEEEMLRELEIDVGRSTLGFGGW